MRFDVAGEPGDPARPNEDYAAVALPASGAGGALVLLDGVTPPAGDDGCQHGVPWFTGRLGSRLLQLATTQRDLCLTDCLTEAIASTAADHQTDCDLSHPRTPQATVIAARWGEQAVEHLVLSDSVLLLESASGEVLPLLDTRLDRLPRQVARIREQVRALPAGSAEHAAARRAYVREVEALRNAPGGQGFYTAAADPTVATKAVTGHTPRADLRGLLALTDGASRWTETFRLGDWASLLSLVRKEGSEALLTQVRAAESADPDGAAFPRGKCHDDATAAFVDLPAPR
ncbi:protein phosphatase 2C domain-containing protein [Streptomyces oceani]|uniref:Integrase n=1 Tax=Streptomyces oceani TaxID=1075402 RepID=A0A1E7KP86_9ACTN|nr:protein phosphatase 2C domain-containing protein [Streptomyces oceani]OEV05789.1 hypothetical protein AN216_02310 [Streptomyces oceani]